MSNAPLEIIVQGGSAEVNALAYGIVQTALSDAGFTDVTLDSPQGDVEANTSEIPSLLEMLRADRPALFDTPIKIRQVAHTDELILLCNDPETIDIARVVYTPLAAGADTPAAEQDSEVTDVEFEEA